MSRVSRRTFMGMAAGAAAVRALPRPVLGMSVEPAEMVIWPELPLNERLQKSITLIETYMRLHETQYRFTRYLSDSGVVLSEDVRPLRPYEELTLMRFDRTQKEP